MKRALSAALVLLLFLCSCAIQPPPMPVTTVGPDILDQKTSADALGALYDTGAALPSDVTDPYIYAIENDLLLFSMSYRDLETTNLQLHRVSTTTGEVVGSVTLAATGYGTLQVFGDVICLCSPPSGKIWVLSASLEIQQEYEFDANYNNWYVSPDLKSLYQLAWDSGLHRYALADGSVNELLPATSSVSWREDNGDSVAFFYVDPQTQKTREAMLDLATGQIRHFSRDGSYSNLYQRGALWLANPADSEMVNLIAVGDGPVRIFTVADTYAYLTQRGEILCHNYITGRVSLYDRTGAFISQLQLPVGEFGPEGYISDQMVWDEEHGGYFLILTTYRYEEDPEAEPIQTTQLVFWDLNTSVQSDDLVMSDYDGVQLPGGNAAEKIVYDRAEEIAQKYGVAVRVADRCETSFENFDTYTVSDTDAVLMALNELEKALCKYPEGFLEQLCYGKIQTLEFSLTGTLTPLREDESGSITAFAQPLEGKYIIVADVYLITDTKFHHELSHVIDHRLDWDAQHSEGAMFSEESWAEMNPNGFDYDWTYALHHDREYFNEKYFMTSYSCTYPTEDRATIWEQAMVGNDYPFGPGPMREKLEYYCACVRDCFDTAGWPDVAPWEQVLHVA